MITSAYESKFRVTLYFGVHAYLIVQLLTEHPSDDGR